MEKEFVPYKESLELKELGFDESCFGYYVDGELRGINLGMEELGGVEPYYQRLGFHTLSNRDIDNPNKIVATAPTFSQAFRWFRENHKLFISFSRYRNSVVIEMPDTFSKVYEIWIQDENEDESVWVECFDTYEEAELACLRKLIEIVKNKQS